MDMEMKTAEQFVKDHQKWLKLYRNNQANWNERPEGREYNLENADLSNQDLKFADLEDANLSNAYLHDAYLQSAYLNGANLQSADLSGADLQSADLSGADLIGANLQDANLNKANLIGANLNHANLNHANLNHANLTNANLTNANLTKTNLIDAYLHSAKFQDARIDEKWKIYIKNQNVRYYHDIKWVEPEDKNEITFEENIPNKESNSVLSITTDKVEHLIDILSHLWRLEQVLISNGISEIEARETITTLCKKRLKDIN